MRPFFFHYFPYNEGMKKLILIISLLSSFLTYSKGQTLNYTEAADVFEILDQVSAWHPKHQQIYRKEWIRTFGEDDLPIFKEFGEMRKTYYSLLSNKSSEMNLLFGLQRIKNDFFSEAFYSAKSVGGALKKLKKRLSKDELKFLSKSLKTLQPKISKWVGESTLYRGKIPEFRKKLKKGKLKTLIKKAKKFFYGKKKIKFDLKMHFVWWPKTEEPIVEIRGNHLLLRFHPVAHLGKLYLDDILVFGILALSHGQEVNQKENLTKVFNQGCQLPKDFPALDIIELPLATAWGKILFTKNQNKKAFSLYKKWSIHPWVNLYSKMLFPLVEEAAKRKEGLSGGFIRAAAGICDEMKAVQSLLTSF